MEASPYFGVMTLREWRTANRLTQQAAADRLGMKRSFLSRIEADARPIPLPIAVRLHQITDGEMHVTDTFPELLPLIPKETADGPET